MATPFTRNPQQRFCEEDWTNVIEMQKLRNLSRIVNKRATVLDGELIPVYSQCQSNHSPTRTQSGVTGVYSKNSEIRSVAL